MIQWMKFSIFMFWVEVVSILQINWFAIKTNI